VFEMAAPIQSPANCEVLSVIRFLNAKVNVQGKFTNKLLLFMVTQRYPLVSSPKETLAGKNFDGDDEVQEEVMTWFKEQAADFYDSGIQKLVPRINKCLDNVGVCFEK